jgi:hypothetical protein
MILENASNPQTYEADCIDPGTQDNRNGPDHDVDSDAVGISGKKKVVHYLANARMDYHDSTYAESSPP